MVEIRITRELGDFTPKFVGPFTLRQFICLVGAGVPCYFLYSSLRGILPVDAIGFLCMIPAAIAAAFGWFRPYGMKMEIFIRSIFITMFLAPANRKYRATNRTKKLLSKIEAAELAAQEEAHGKAKKKKAKPMKYKRSSLAYK